MYKHEKKKPEQDHRQDHERELAGPFFAVLFLLTLVAFLIPLRPETSLRERRKLREFPQFSVQTLLSGDYFDDITAWFSDTFPGREKMLEVADRIDSLHGLMRYEVAMTDSNTADDSAKLDALLEEAEAAAAVRPETPVTPRPDPASEDEIVDHPAEAPGEETAETIAEETEDPDTEIEDWTGLDGEEEMRMYGDLVVVDGVAMSRMGFEKTVSDHHAQLMNQAGDALAEQGIRFFNIPVPTSISVLLSSEMLKEMGTADQGKTLRYMFAQENDNVYKVNAFNNLVAHNTEYLYFYSDHHWTARGAYYAYEEFCRTAGFEPVPLREYTELNMGKFIGSYSYSVATKLKEDEMIAYVPPGNISMEIPNYPKATTVIVDETEEMPNAKYNCFINGDNQVTTITNEDLPDAPDCLVIKDSFGNPFVVYLTQHYHRVIVLDYRKNFKPVTSYAEKYGVQDVILVQSIGVSQSKNAQLLLDNLMK